MVVVALRDDGWFDTGKDETGLARTVYDSKQRLKTLLEGIDAPDLATLGTKLRELPDDTPEFSGRPYLDDEKIYIQMDGLPGLAYLGFARVDL